MAPIIKFFGINQNSIKALAQSLPISYSSIIPEFLSLPIILKIIMPAANYKSTQILPFVPQSLPNYSTIIPEFLSLPIILKN